MHSTAIAPEALRAQDGCSIIRATTLSPFTTIHDPLHPQRTIEITDPISIPTSGLQNGVLTLAWAILLSSFSASTTLNIDTNFWRIDGSAVTADTIELQLHAGQTIPTMLAAITEKLKIVHDQEVLSPGKDIDESKDIRKPVVSIVSPWTSYPTAHAFNNFEGHPWPALQKDEILCMVIQPRTLKSLSCCIHYVGGIGFEDVASRFAYQFSHLVNQIRLDNSSLQLQQLDMVSETDRATLENWNAQSSRSVLECCHNLFRGQAEKHPSALAISAWDGELTYSDLDILSERLANELRGNGVRTGLIVPLLFEKSKWMVVAMLAVLKAGGTCVSLCADYPDSYVDTICKKCSPKGVICSQSQSDRLKNLGFVRWVVPNIIETSVVFDDHSVHSDPHDVAHIIFTSGSTGEPKGVILTHEAIATATHYQSHALNIHQSSRVLQFSSYAFDMSVLECWYALTRGACLCIPSEHQRLWELPSFIRDHRASWTFFTPTFLRNYTVDELCDLETVVLGGEPVTNDLVAKWKNHVRLFNLWGPSEGCGGASIEIIPDSWIPGTFGTSSCCNLWIVQPDDAEHLSAIGAVGEIVMEGTAVAQGYLTDPLQTGAVFIPPPKWRDTFAQPINGRFYKTGDLAQYNSDGTIRYLSRKDTMVKINGQRVDVDQVEIALRRLEPDRSLAVDAVLLPGRSGRSDPVLFAFLENPVGIEWEDDLITVKWPTQASHSFHTEASRILKSLAKTLPRFMVPLFVIPVSQMPIGATGKVDKKRLRKAVTGMSHTDLVTKLNTKSRPLANDEEHLPLTVEEHTLLETVAHVLKIDPSAIDLDRPFREFGGDSVSAILVARHLATKGQFLRWEGLLDAEHSLRKFGSSVQIVEDCRKPVPQPFSLMQSVGDITALRQVAAQQCSVSEADIEDMYPCTPIQEGLLSITSSLGSTAYIDRFLFHLPRGTCLEDAKRSFNVAVHQLPVLRTRIVQPSGGYPYQVVVKQSIDWRNYSSKEDFILAEESLFMAFGTPLVSFSCFKGEAQCETLALTLHHAIYDGWTLSLLLRLVEQTYHGSTTVEHLPFSLFVQHLQEESDPVAAANFWRHEFKDVEPCVFPHYPSSEYVPRAETTLRKSFEIPSSDGLVSPTVRLRLAWGLLLSFYSGTDDVTFGNVLDGRRGDFPGIEAIAGPTIATVPVRCQIDHESTVLDGLLQLEEARSRAIPFEQSGLQHIARAGEDAALACRFRSLLVMQSISEGFDSPAIFGRVEKKVGDMQGFPGYGLILICEPKFGTWSMELLVDTNLISSCQAARMLNQLSHFVCQISRYDCKIGDLDLLCDEDRTQLSLWQADPIVQPEGCLHDLFAQVAAKNPEGVAVATWQGIRLTYAQLDELSSRISSSLLSECDTVERNTICILLPRSHWVPIAILAVMKSGHPFVLLDLEQAATRHEMICDRVRPILVVTVKDLADQARKLCDSVFLIDSYTPKSVTLVSGVNVTAKDVAYIVFTSGSTGEPKAVVIEHGQFAAAAVAQQKSLNIHPRSRVLHISSYAFDSFAVEILTTLCAGASVCIPPDEECRTGIAAAVQRFQATWMVITPSMLRLVDSQEVPSLETVVAVGESMLVDQAEDWSSRVQLLCGYGPTECCTGASAQLIDHSAVNVRKIGKGMGAHLWLVHKHNHNHLVPAGAVGEIVIQGPIVGREYLDNLNKTQEVFFDNTPWASQLDLESHGRFYKTGDLGRYDEDGSVIFLGRDNQQIKLRGQRLDLTLVEYHLQLAFGAGCTVVSALINPKGSEGHPLLVAMVYMSTEADPSVVDDNTATTFSHHSPIFTSRLLHAQKVIQEALPSVIVPSLFLQLSKLPLLLSGKVNRRALKRLAEATSAQELATLGRVCSQEVVDNLSEDEIIAQTLSRWLNDLVQKRFHASETQSASGGILGQNVNPGQLGLDSIDMVMLTQSINREFGVAIPTSTLFQTVPTIRDIAAMIASSSTQCNDEVKTILPKIAPWWKNYQELEVKIDNLLPEAKSMCRDAESDQLIMSKSSRHVFLTGATGFLGTRILQSLVGNADIESVTLLVRGRNMEAAFARIIGAATQANWWRQEYRRVIRIWLGDLTQPNLGLSDPQYEILCGETFDSIIHCAASVHWLYDYEALQASNVQPTFTLLEALSRRQTPIRFTYISALRPGETGKFMVSDDANEIVSKEPGYSQTKLVSELLIQRYIHSHGTQGHSFTIVRPGLMMGAVMDGVANLDDVIWRTVSAALDVAGYNGQEDDSWIYISPVDWVASAVIHATFHHAFRSSSDSDDALIVSVDDGLHVKEFWNAIMKATSRPLNPMNGSHWLDLVQERVATMGSHHPLSTVIEFAIATSGCIGSSLLTQHRDAQKSWYSAQSMLWLAVVRNAEYLTSLDFWKSGPHEAGQRSAPSRTNFLVS